MNSVQDSTGGEMPLRVMTYNILNGGQGREELILQVIQAVQPDVIVLQEVIQNGLLKYLAADLGMEAWFLSGNNWRRVALLSRLSIKSIHSYHPRPFIPQNVVVAQIESRAGRTFWLFGLHAMANLFFPFELWRWREARHLLKHFKETFAEPCLIAGDFNTIGPGDRVLFERMPGWLKLLLYAQGKRVYPLAMREYSAAGFSDCYRALHSEDGFTLPAKEPNSRLDHILANRPLEAALRDCRVVREPAEVALASDHCPVVAEFSF